MKPTFPQHLAVYYPMRQVKYVVLASHLPKAAHEHTSALRAVLL